MDIDRARTFLEIVHSGSFLKAADRLHVTQTTVSARIRTLEDVLGRQLFIRNRNGAQLTPAGREFERYAQSFVQIWERARHQLAIPSGRTSVVALGGELSLWDPMLLDWLGERHSRNSLREAAVAVERAIDATLADAGARTADLMGPEGGTPVSTTQMGDVILEALDASL